MKRLKLFAIAFLAISSSYAQLGLTLSGNSPQEISKITPDSTIKVTDVIPNFKADVIAVPRMKGMTSSTIEFYNSKNLSKISECPDKINGQPTGYFIEDNSKYLFVTFDKDLKSWVFQQVEVATGKTLSKVKIETPSPIFTGGAFNESKTEFICVGDPKTKTSDTSLVVISVNSGEILRKFGLTKTRVNKLVYKVLNDDFLVCALTPDKKSKEVNESTTSNLAIYDLETGLFRTFKNTFFKDNKSKPKDIYFDGANTIYVTYNDAKPVMVAYNINTLNSIFELNDTGIPQCNTEDSKYLFCASNNVIKVVDVQEQKVVKSFSEDKEDPVPYTNLSISKDGNTLSGNRVGYYQHGLEAKDHISFWKISKLVN